MTAGYWSNRIHIEQTARQVLVTGTQFKGDPPQIRDALKNPDLKFEWRKELQAWRYDRDPARLDEAAEAIRQVLAAADRQAAARGVVAPADKPRFPPTPQQQAAIDAVKAGQTVALLALAGTGKTTTMRQVAEALLDKKITYLAFNRTIADEAAEVMPRNVTAVTSHAIAKRALSTGPLAAKLRRVGKVKVGKGRNERKFARWPKDVAPVLGITRPHTIGKDIYEPEDLAELALATVHDYRISAADHINPGNLPYAVRQIPELASLILPYAQAAWDDICAPDGRLIFEHDDYRKIWIESRPIIDADLIIFDEAQDINPVLAKLVQNQPTQTVVVGDSYQSIYGFTGAVDALATWPADVVLPLTQSWRFGPRVAEVGNQFLRLLGADLQLQGNPALDTALAPVDNPDAVLTRTNVGAVAAVIDAMNDDRKVALVGGGQEIKDVANAAKDLQAGRSTDHPELSRFANWKQVVAAADEGDRSLQMFVRLINRYSPDGLIRTVKDLVPETSEDPDNQPDVIVSTAHKAKGREWDNVRIGADFHQPSLNEDGEETLPEPEELRLSYVTVTRGKKCVELGSLAWILNAPAAEASRIDAGPDRAPVPTLAAPTAARAAAPVIEPPTARPAADSPRAEPRSPAQARSPQQPELKSPPPPESSPVKPAPTLTVAGNASPSRPSTASGQALNAEVAEATAPPSPDSPTPPALADEPETGANLTTHGGVWEQTRDEQADLSEDEHAGHDQEPAPTPNAPRPDEATTGPQHAARDDITPAAAETDDDRTGSARTAPATEPPAPQHQPAAQGTHVDDDLQDGYQDVLALFAEHTGRDLDSDDPAPAGPYAGDAAAQIARTFAQLKRLLDEDRPDAIAAINTAAGNTPRAIAAAGRARTPALPPELEPIHQELRTAHATSSWYYDTPQWQQVKAITAALRDLGAAIRSTPGSYLDGLAQDVRARGFVQTATARACRLIASSCRTIATGLERARLGDTPGWLAIHALHNRAADFADQLMGALPPGWTLQTLDGLRQNWDTLRARLGRTIPTRQTGTRITSSAISGLRTALTAAAGQASETRAWQRLTGIWNSALPVLSQVHQGTLRFENDAKSLGLLETTWLRTCELASFTARHGMDRLEADTIPGAHQTRWHALRLLRHAAEQNIAHLRGELAPGTSAPIGTYDRQTAGRGDPHPTGQPEQTPAPTAPSPDSPANAPDAVPAAAPEPPTQPTAPAEPSALDGNWIATEYLAGRPPRDEQAARLYRKYASELTRTDDPAVLERLTARLDAYDAYDGPMTWTQWTATRLAAPTEAPDHAPLTMAAGHPSSQARTTAAQAKAGFPQPVGEQLKATQTGPSAAPSFSPPRVEPAITAIPNGPER